MEWAVAGPQIAKILQIVVFEDQIDEEDEFRYHHEDTDIFESTFCKERKAVINAFKMLGNPFEEKEPGLVNIATRHVLDDAAAQSARKADKRLVQQTKSLYHNIKTKKLQLFRKKYYISAGKQKEILASSKSERQLYASLYVGAQSRNVDLTSII